jgi:hypothetical protein
MSIIVVRCPKTGKEILPGIEIAEADFRSIPAAADRVRCPVCGEQHTWLPYAARMAEALAASMHKAPFDPAADTAAGTARTKVHTDVVR